jgi:hypothetical protein
MKTHLLQLNSFDDCFSIIDNMNWSKANRILIVWPDKGTISLNEKDLLLLLRKAESLGSQLAIVSDEKKIIELSKFTGIQVFSSIPEANKKSWRRSKKIRRKISAENREQRFTRFKNLSLINKRRLPESNRFIRIFFFLIGCLSVLALTAFFIPSAIVEVKTISKTVEIELDLWTNPDIKSSIVSGAIPLEIVYKVKTDIYQGNSTGTIRIPSNFAMGNLKFRNLTDRRMTIPEGTIVRTSSEPSIRFKTLNSLTLSGEFNSEAQVQAISMEGGVIGNVPPLAINSIEGLIGGNIVVENPEEFRGGSETKTLSPSDLDFEIAKSALIEIMEKELFNEIQMEHPEGYLFPKESLKLSKIIYEKKIPEVNVPGESFQYQLSCEFSVWMIKQEDLNIILNNVMDANLPVGYTRIPDSLLTKNITQPVFDNNGDLKWKINAIELIKPIVETDQITNQITGKRIDAAISILDQSEYLDKQSEITVSPNFLKRLPFIPFRIKVIINE